MPPRLTLKPFFKTGNRRWYSFESQEIRIDELRRDRDQLWAEAVYRERAGESIEIPREFWAAQAEEAKRCLERTEVHQAIVDKLNGLKGGLEGCFIATEDIWKIVGIDLISDKAKFGPDKNRAMEELEFEPRKSRLVTGGEQIRGFYNPKKNDQGVTVAPVDQIIVNGFGSGSTLTKIKVDND